MTIFFLSRVAYLHSFEAPLVRVGSFLLSPRKTCCYILLHEITKALPIVVIRAFCSRGLRVPPSSGNWSFRRIGVKPTDIEKFPPLSLSYVMFVVSSVSGIWLGQFVIRGILRIHLCTICRISLGIWSIGSPVFARDGSGLLLRSASRWVTLLFGIYRLVIFILLLLYYLSFLVSGDVDWLCRACTSYIEISGHGFFPLFFLQSPPWMSHCYMYQRKQALPLSFATRSKKKICVKEGVHIGPYSILHLGPKIRHNRWIRVVTCTVTWVNINFYKAGLHMIYMPW